MMLRARASMALGIAWISVFIMACASSNIVGRGVVLTAEKNRLELPSVLLTGGRNKQFVRIDVRDVVNPDAVPLNFRVSFRPQGSESIHLGDFALFPADNPGRFIVPIAGRMRGPGSLLITLEPDRRVSAPLRVELGGVGLSDGP